MPFVCACMHAQAFECTLMLVYSRCTCTYDCLPKNYFPDFVLKGAKPIYMKLINMKRHIQRIRVYCVR